LIYKSHLLLLNIHCLLYLELTLKRKKFYHKYIDRSLPLNDQLSVTQAVMANERTLLSFLRTALAILVAGLSLIKFFELEWMVYSGWILFIVSFLTITMGIVRFSKMKALIQSIEKHSHKLVVQNKFNSDSDSD
jgi:putative membrane protein